MKYALVAAAALLFAAPALAQTTDADAHAAHHADAPAAAGTA